MQVVQGWRRTYDFVPVLIVGIFLHGCSKPTAGPKTVKVTGKVTYQDKAVPEAHVTFLGDGTIQAAQGITDSNGNFTLKTANVEGAMPGNHQVIVTKTEAPAPAAQGSGMSMDSAAKAGSVDAAAQVKHLIPEKYSKASSSNLTFVVKEGDKNHFEIPLSD